VHDAAFAGQGLTGLRWDRTARSVVVVDDDDDDG
jgi:hypothetical protein